jgi:PrgI family protein
MASYQVPQFLDSGEKILLNMNIRQFAYGLVGFLICTGIYYGINGFINIGFYALIPVLPLAIVFAYLALGKYNGRDSEVYILKAIIYFTKPRILKFKRMPDTSDLDEKLKEWTYEKVLSRWNKDLDNQNDYNGTNTGLSADSENSKISRIRNLSKQVDEPLRTAMITVRKSENDLQKTENLISLSEKARREEFEKKTKSFFDQLPFKLPNSKK